MSTQMTVVTLWPAETPETVGRFLTRRSAGSVANRVSQDETGAVLFRVCMMSLRIVRSL
jgi:hypothetical protein